MRLSGMNGQLEPEHSGVAAAPITVVLADDHHPTRRALRLLLEAGGEVEVLAEASDLTSAMRHVTQQAPQVLLLDLAMPNGSSIAMIRRVRQKVPGTAVVVVTMRDNAAFVKAALDAGAIGYVLKDDADSELPEAIRRAVRGEPYVSPEIAGRFDGVGREPGGEVLSPREADVLRLIALGYANHEIADRMHVSSRTLESHRHRIHGKLGLDRRWQLVAYARGHDLVDSPRPREPDRVAHAR